MIVISATFVADPVERPLKFVLGEAGLPTDVSVAPYHQVFQQLLNPASSLAANAGGTGILLVRLEDFVRDQPDADDARRTIRRTAQELGGALAKYAPRVTGALILCVLPPSASAAPEVSGTLREAGEDLCAVAAALPGISVLDPNGIAALAGGECEDPLRDSLAHVPFTERYFAAMALALARRVHVLLVPAAKVLVLDCDNTLWGGVVGEDGTEGIEITPAFSAVQTFAVEQQAKGILLCLASKNSESDVLDVFARRDDMILRLHHIAAHRISWDPKPKGIASLAEELNLGLDSFVFLDDNPIECAQMRAELPQVVTIQLRPDGDVERRLRSLWVFDKLVTTAEDASRTRMYRENSARRALETTVGDIGEFIAALDLKIDVGAPEAHEWPRVAQLTQRTNQFNFTTRRQTQAEMERERADGVCVLRVRVSDRFGDYGLVGVIVARRATDHMRIENLMLSCRVLGRGVEHAMLRELADQAEAWGVDTVLLEYVPTARNEPARAFADSILSDLAERSEASVKYRIPVSRLRYIQHRPGSDPVEVIEARLAEERKGTKAQIPTTSAANRSDRYARLAEVLNSGEAVLRELSVRRQAREFGTPAARPQSPNEERMLKLWEQVLAIDGIGVDDDYVALGGTSLLSVTLFARIHEEFGTRLRLTSILDAPTVRQLTALVLAHHGEGRDGLVCLRPGSQRNLFLVHDGLGETLLYHNLAQRMPPGIAVYGIEPRRLPGIPLAHTSIEQMAAFYVEQIHKIQPQGPYLLGGMCAGGLIAYEMAACLSRAGESVQIVTILDGATPQAAKKEVGALSGRISRLHESLARERREPVPLLKKWIGIASTVWRKVLGFADYVIRSLAESLWVRARLLLLRRILTTGGTWPSFLPELTVMQIYGRMEARYIPPPLENVPVLLVRASTGEHADTPLREVYRDEDFGWRHVAPRLELVDVRGGHSSMLQEHHVDSLASAMVLRLASPRLAGAVSDL